MAEAIARRDAADVMEASSAGLAPMGAVMLLTRKTLEVNGYSIAGLSSKGISKELWAEAELVINMSGRSREMLFADWEKVEDWKVEDPYGADPAVYQRIFEEIEGRVGELAKRLRERGE
ncbi:MAG: low molecular weight phosphatase family protein [Acidobacteriia bacterium]|nr:low molecular weight phosphatase family protein [Terriglobia bacterium]